jgi:hypothetical protein
MNADLDNPKAITREHALFLRAKERHHQNRTLLRLSNEMQENDTKEIVKNKSKTKKKLNHLNFEKSTNIDQSTKGAPDSEMERVHEDTVQTRGNTSERRIKKKGKKSRFQKGIGRGKVTQKDDHPKSEIENNGVQNLTLPDTSVPSISSRRTSFVATIDISDNEGHLERSVLIDSVVEGPLISNETKD